MLLGCLCACSNTPGARGARARAWRDREWCHRQIIQCVVFALMSVFCDEVRLINQSHPCVSLRGQYCFTVCVKSFGPLTRNYYVRAFLHAAWVHYVSRLSFAGQHSTYSQSHFRYGHYSPLSLKSLSVFNSICVPGGFMLATVLGCVCLGIASIIYFVVSWSNFATFD